MTWTFKALLVLLLTLTAIQPIALAQATLGTQLAELASLKDKARNADTRIRVDAFHKAWAIGLESDNSQVKLSALDVMTEPVGSSSDHIRMPAIYAIAEIANSTTDVQVKTRAIAVLRAPIQASQLPIRIAAIDALNGITRAGNSGDVPLEALKLLGEPVRSGNNGVRIPAINSVVRTVEHCNNDSAYGVALDLLVAPLDSAAMIGGMEVRMMAVVAVEQIGVEASAIGTKAKAMGLLQSYATREGWEPEARTRAAQGAAKIQGTMKEH